MSDPAWKAQPDPALSRSRPLGLHPHQHDRDRLHGWVFLQHQVWVDYWGNEHEIELMASDYVQNVIAFCEARCERIQLVVCAELLYRALLHIAGVAPPPRLEQLEAALPSPQALGDERALTSWLHGLPLMRALLLRSERS